MNTQGGSNQIDPVEKRERDVRAALAHTAAQISVGPLTDPRGSRDDSRTDIRPTWRVPAAAAAAVIAATAGIAFVGQHWSGTDPTRSTDGSIAASSTARPPSTTLPTATATTQPGAAESPFRIGIPLPAGQRSIDAKDPDLGGWTYRGVTRGIVQLHPTRQPAINVIAMPATQNRDHTPALCLAEARVRTKLDPSRPQQPPSEVSCLVMQDQYVGDISVDGLTDADNRRRAEAVKRSEWPTDLTQSVAPRDPRLGKWGILYVGAGRDVARVTLDVGSQTIDLTKIDDPTWTKMKLFVGVTAQAHVPGTLTFYDGSGRIVGGA